MSRTATPHARGGFCPRWLTPARWLKAAALFSIAALTPFAAAPAHAGHWVITLSGEGSTPHGSTGSFTDSQFDGSHTNLTLNDSGCYVYWGSTGAVSLGVTAKLTWTRDNVPPPYAPDTSSPPPTVDVLEIAGADSSQFLFNPTGLSTDANDGLGDAVTHPDAPSGPGGYGSDSTGKHLHHLTVPAGQDWVMLPTRSLGASLSWDTTQMTGSPGMNVNYAVQLDNRAVTIISAATNKKVPDLDANDNQTTDANGDLDYKAVPNTPDSDGTMNGDTIYTYHSLKTTVVGDTGGGGTLSLLDSPVQNWIEFTSAYTGNWHYKQGITHSGDSVIVPDVVSPDTWSWSPSESEDTWDYAKCLMPWAINYSVADGVPTGKDAPTKYPISYSATDNTDNVMATANYNMMVHDPSEKNYPDHATYRNKENFRKYPNAQWVSSGNDPTKSYDLEVHTDTSESIDITISPGGKLEKWMSSVLGFTLDISASYDVGVGQGETVKDVELGYGTYCMSYEMVDYHVGKVDSWGVTGYEGTSPYNIRVHENPAVGIQAAPLVRTSGSPPTPPG